MFPSKAQFRVEIDKKLHGNIQGEGLIFNLTYAFFGFGF